MNILLTNHSLREAAGTERYTLEIGQALKHRGHKVTIYSPNLGEFAQVIKKKGLNCTDDVEYLTKSKIDIIHANHNVTAIIARSIFPDVPMIFTSHGVIPELEQPPSINIGIAKYIAVSEEVKDNLIQKHGIAEETIEIARNFVDTERFKQIEPVNQTLQNILVISNHLEEEASKVIIEACEKMELNLNHIGLPGNPVVDVENYINNADLIISLGKGVLEAMACERNVIVFDKYGGDGLLTNEVYLESRRNNFSGRRFGYKYKSSDLITEFKKFDPNLGKELRQIIIDNHSIARTALFLENLYNSYLGKKPTTVFRKGVLLNEFLFLEKYFGVSDTLFVGSQEKDKKILRYEDEIHNAAKALEQKDQHIHNIEKDHRKLIDENQKLQDKIAKQNTELNIRKRTVVNFERIKDIIKGK